MLARFTNQIFIIAHSPSSRQDACHMNLSVGCVPLGWSNELLNPCPEWNHRFIWSTIIWVIMDPWNKKLKVIGSCRFLAQCFLLSGLCHVTENRTVTNIFLCLLLTVHITGKTYLLTVQCPGKTYSVTVEIIRCCHILVGGDLESFPFVFFSVY